MGKCTHVESLPLPQMTLGDMPRTGRCGVGTQHPHPFRKASSHGRVGFMGGPEHTDSMPSL